MKANLTFIIKAYIFYGFNDKLTCVIVVVLYLEFFYCNKRKMKSKKKKVIFLKIELMNNRNV